MSFSVTMPALGESVSEGTVTRWLKQEGEPVEVDEPLLEVSTDKVDTEIPSPAAGVLQRIVVAEDATVEVGAELAVIADAAEGTQPAGDGAGAASPAPPAAPDREQDGGGEPAPAAASAPAAPAEVASPSEQPSSPDPGQPQAAGQQPVSASDGSDSGTPVTMPALGESVSEGTVTRWLKNVGDRVEVDEPLLEVSTDKVDTEIPSPASGVLVAVSVQADETVPVGAELAVIGSTAAAEPGQEQPAPAADPGAAAVAESPQPSQQEQVAQQAGPTTAGQEQQPQDQAPARQGTAEAGTRPETDLPPAETAVATAPAPAPPPAAPQPAAPQSPGQRAARSSPDDVPSPPPPVPSSPAAAADGGTSGGGGAAYVTPLVRKLAAENSVDLSVLTGTGVGGRIRKQDVLEAAARAKQSAEAAPSAAGAPASATEPVGERGQGTAPVPVSPLRGTTEKMSRLRKVIAARMVESLQTSAQLTTVAEVDITKVARLRETAKRDFEAREGVRLSFLPFFAKAAVEALKTYPKLNASIDGDSIVYHGGEHLGVAVDTERGLLVPVIKDAGDLNLAGLARRIADLAERTRSNKITPDELGGGTFTLTNTGSRGALFDTPIINQPQVGILGTGAVVKRPMVVATPELGETIAVRSMVYLALSYDHRLVDGADAARFLAAIKARLEEAAFDGDLGT